MNGASKFPRNASAPCWISLTSATGQINQYFQAINCADTLTDTFPHMDSSHCFHFLFGLSLNPIFCTFVYLLKLSNYSKNISWFLIVFVQSSLSYSQQQQTSELFCIKRALALLCLRTLVNMHTPTYHIHLKAEETWPIAVFTAQDASVT